MFTGLWKNRKRLASKEIQTDLSVSSWQAASFETYLARHTNTSTCFLPWAAGETEPCFIPMENGKAQSCEWYKTDQEQRRKWKVRKNLTEQPKLLSFQWSHLHAHIQFWSKVSAQARAESLHCKFTQRQMRLESGYAL